MALATEVIQRYRATRAHYPKISASVVLAAMRGEDIPIKLRDYRPAGAYGPRITRERTLWGKKITDLTARRFVESTAHAGLRFVGYADEIAPRSVEHRGWFLDEDIQDGVYRGAVWQLPARLGSAVYVAGYADPLNDGAALIDFSPIYGTRGGTGSYADEDWDARLTAARAADSIAEHDAETEREYHRKWHAARRVEDLRDQIASARTDHSELAAELRSERNMRARLNLPERTKVCAALRRELAEQRETVHAAVRDIRELISDYGAEILGPDFN